MSALPHPPQMLDVAAAAAIARASLVLARAVPGARRDEGTVSGHAQKAVLLAIWATEGTPVTIAALAKLACCAQSGAWRAVEALVQRGAVVRMANPRPGQPNVFRINLEQIQSMAADVRLCDRHAAKKTYNAMRREIP